MDGGVFRAMHVALLAKCKDEARDVRGGVFFFFFSIRGVGHV